MAYGLLEGGLEALAVGKQLALLDLQLRVLARHQRQVGLEDALEGIFVEGLVNQRLGKACQLRGVALPLQAAAGHGVEAPAQLAQVLAGERGLALAGGRKHIVVARAEAGLPVAYQQNLGHEGIRW